MCAVQDETSQTILTKEMTPTEIKTRKKETNEATGIDRRLEHWKRRKIKLRLGVWGSKSHRQKKHYQSECLFLHRTVNCNK